MDIVARHPELLDDEARARSGWLFAMPELHVIRNPDESRRLNEDASPKIIVAASGMCEGGPVLHHLRHHLWRPQTDVLFAGYQAEGTLGRKILEGAKHVLIQGRRIAVKARIHEMTGLSAHADRNGLIRWARSAGRPKRTFLNHGEPAAAKALAAKISAELGHDPFVPSLGSSHEI
jgi:metallo-beta-lactamase family protein